MVVDQHKLRSHVFDKTGIKIDTDDPIFALVALNEAVLAETIERQLAILNAATDALAAQACAAGGLSPLAKPAIPAAAPAPATHASGLTPREWRLLGAAAIVSLATSLLVLGGAALLWR